MGKAGSQTSKVELPPELTEAAIANLDIANEVAAKGYTPYTGPSVAGFSPMQLQAMEGTNLAAHAFGMPSARPRAVGKTEALRALTGLPDPRRFAGGLRGYTAAPAYQQQQRQLPPEVRKLIDSMFMNPRTGAAPRNPSVPTPLSMMSQRVTRPPLAADTLLDQPRPLEPWEIR